MSNASNTFDNFRTVDAEWITNRIMLLWQIFRETGERQTLYIEGPPGGGKTMLIREACSLIAESMGRKLVDTPTPGPDELGLRVIHMGNIGEEVVAGLPWVDKDESILHRAMDVMWPRGGEGILYLDEPFQFGPAQRFVGQLTSDGKFGDYFDLGNWLIVMSGNAQDNRAGTVRIWTHVQNRIEHVRYMPDVGKALSKFRRPATPEVSVYLRWFPQKLHEFSVKGGPFPSPRAWDKWNTNMSFGVQPTGDGFPVLQGLVGPDTALDFKVTFDAVKNLPDIDGMLANPGMYSETVRAMGANNPASVCAMASVFVRKYQEDRDMNMVDRAIQLLAFSSAEHVAAFVAVAEGIDRQVNDGLSVNDTPGYTRYMATHSEYTAN